MTATLQAEDPAVTVPRLGGDPGAIRQSARTWSSRSAEFSLLAGQVRGAAPEGFVGDEADSYRAWLSDRWAARLEGAAQAWATVGRALAGYADDLDRAQQRLRAVAVQAAAQAQVAAQLQVDSGDGSVDADVRGRPPPDPWIASTADRALAEHAEAVARCRTAIDHARALCPGRESGPGTLRQPAFVPGAGGRVGTAPTGGPGSRGDLASVAAGLRMASGLLALAWSVRDAASAVGSAAPADGSCGDTPPPAGPDVTSMPTATPGSQWPELLGVPANTPDLPIYDSTTTAPSAPALAPVPTATAPVTVPPTAPATTGPAPPATPSAAPSASAAPTGAPVTAQQGCTDAEEPQIARLPRSGPFPFEPIKGQRLSLPQSITRRDGGFVDKYGQVWEWSEDRKQDGNGEHHGHWDVENKRTGKHTNVNTDGTINHKENQTGRNPKPGSDSTNSINWLDDLLGGVFTVHLDPRQAAKVAALTALAGGMVYIFGGVLAGG